jgi:hypothetical protein
MLNDPLISQFEKDVYRTMAVPDARSEFVASLRSRLVSEAPKLEAPQPVLFKLRLAWAIPLFFVIALLVSTVVIGPQKVWAAVREFFGYLPGIGYVQTDGTLLTLAEPVSVEREGITVTVEQVVADNQRTVLIYKVQGLSVQAANSQGEGAVTGSIPLLRLADGSELTPTSGGGPGWGSGYRARLIYPALPPGENSFIFVIPRLMSMPPGVSPEDWEIPLTLEPAAGEVTLMPVEELAPIRSETQSAPDSPALESQDANVIFSLDRVVELEDGFLLEGTLRPADNQSNATELLYSIEVSDSEGNRVPSKEVPPDEAFPANSPAEISWAVRTFTKDLPGPWTISIPQIGLTKQTQINLLIDLGDNPQVGDEWQVNQSFEVGETKFTLASITLEQGSRLTNYRLSYRFRADESIYAVNLQDLDRPGLGGSGGTGPWEDGVDVIMDYETIPTGVHNISITSIGVQQESALQLTWQPPETNGVGMDETPQPETCLTPESWKALFENGTVPLPEDVSGNLLMLTQTGQMLPVISLVGLGTDFRQEYGTGAWVSLSPDGRNIAVPGDDGIYLVDTATGQRSYLTGSYGGDYPLWSPDGDQVAFHVWNDASIYRVRRDGAELTRVYTGSDVVYPSAWTPDGQQIMYLGFGDEGMAVKAVDIATGQSETWIQTKDNKPISRPRISPDGQWILFADLVEGDSGKGISIARIDGTGKRLLASSYDYSQISLGIGVWSPDGKWVVVNIHDFSISTTNPVPVLISIDTCQVIPLIDLSGEVTGWGP